MREDFEHEIVARSWEALAHFRARLLAHHPSPSWSRQLSWADVHWGTRIGAVGNVIAGLGFTVMARVGTIANAQGIRATQFRTQQIAWSEVKELRADPPGPWATDVQAILADGSAITLPAVPASDLPRLETLRS